RERYGVGDHRRAPIIAPPKPEQLSLLSLAGSLTTAAGSWVDLETRILRPESHRGAALVSTH
ncbi:MAG TPA: hypothetical protein VJB57_19535, partial [Dehalococcoidia bacterium]|nr:hypothetical protein [Dehalococcoidia bacterium]